MNILARILIMTLLNIGAHLAFQGILKLGLFRPQSNELNALLY